MPDEANKLIEKIAEIMPDVKPNSVLRAKRVLRIVLNAIQNGEIVRIENYYSGLGAGQIVQVRQAIELKEGFAEFLQGENEKMSECQACKDMIFTPKVCPDKVVGVDHAVGKDKSV